MRKEGREEKEEEKVRGERRLGTGDVLEVNLVKENKAGLLQILLGTKVVWRLPSLQLSPEPCLLAPPRGKLPTKPGLTSGPRGLGASPTPCRRSS